MLIKQNNKKIAIELKINENDLFRGLGQCIGYIQNDDISNNLNRIIMCVFVELERFFSRVLNLLYRGDYRLIVWRSISKSITY